MSSNSAGGAGKEGGGENKKRPIPESDRSTRRDLLLSPDALAKLGKRPKMVDIPFIIPSASGAVTPSLNMSGLLSTYTASESGARKNRKTATEDMERQYALRAKFRKFWAEFKEETQNKDRCDLNEMNDIFEAVNAVPDTVTLNMELAAVPFDASDQVAEDVALVLSAVFTKLNAMLRAGADVPIQYVANTTTSAKNWLNANKEAILSTLYTISQWCGGAFALWLIKDNIAYLFTNVWGIAAFTGASAASSMYILNRIGKDSTVVNTVVDKFINEADFTTMGYEKVAEILPTIIGTLKTRRDERSLAALTTLSEKLNTQITGAANIGTMTRETAQLREQLNALNQDIARIKRGGRNTRRKRNSMKTKAKKHHKKSHKRHTK